MTSQMTLKWTQCSHLYRNITTKSNGYRLLFNRLFQTIHHWPKERKTARKCSSLLHSGNHTESMFSLKCFRQPLKGDSDSSRLGFRNFVTHRIVTGGLASSQQLWMCARDCCRRFSTSLNLASKFGVGGSDHEQPETSQHGPRKDWALRLANENGYLSWCRNTYLTTVVALALMEEGKTAFAEQAAKGALVVAALNLTWGTYQYIYTLVRLRHQTGVSVAGVSAYAALALLHLALWVMVCAVFMGYTQDPAESDTTTIADSSSSKTEADAHALEQ